MDEAMRCDRVALIQTGKLLSVDTPAKDQRGFSRKLFTVKAPEKYKLINALRQFPFHNHCIIHLAIQFM